jgi:hypothetical protein
VNFWSAVHVFALPKFKDIVPEPVIVLLGLPVRPLPAATEVTVPPELVSVKVGHAVLQSVPMHNPVRPLT